ncbi:hypothetical protein FT663_04568 [Candidozyma haemuli var. vulneris]|uniref:N-terminal acetyltransferase B complex subunit MDM20 n=1 Tax=Candidozyma haemuli TaxID=45357 RepID=A0A2V1AYQ2_9ASCO|nr:hypothetical protein CXQ85_002659 [[Candida] haemuloni]KAF3987172.1 hypothetical protein FT663_04568 [[Candida] haemuloni var. vulneris]KAF3992048.1 hypothetical protein FT662_01357 [[Candida] haemuloni var. vulneris]PVH22934.1 hypothetical protein CXQ85_002659 [[Candida] haemuloni]
MGESDILAAIQEGRLSSARLELERCLKRFPNKSYYWALNCYLLFAQGKIAQSITQCKELASKTPSDRQALSVLYDSYLKLGLAKEANQLYDNAIKKYPTKELIEAYFDKALENYDMAGVQKASLQLQKNFKSNREYAYRAAFSCYLLSRKGSEKEKALYLGLAAGIADKTAPHENNQEVFVQAKILHAQEKFTEVVKLLEPMKHRELELTLLYLDSLNRSENWELLHTVSKDLLFNQEFNDVDTWKHFINASSHLQKPQEEVSSFIKFDTRNSYFANIHFAVTYGLDQFAALEKYYNKFHDKPSGASDLLNFDLSEKLLEKIQADYTNLTEKESLTSSEAWTLVNTSKILIQQKKLTLSEEKFSKFDNIELFDLQLVKMIESLRSDNSTSNIVKHIIVLEDYTIRDPENYKVKVWLLNLYTYINATSSAVKVYKSLKIKMIQQDTLSYKLDLAPSVGNLNELISIYRFYMTADTEVGPYVEQSFQKNLYTKVEDFFKFGERLTNSLSRHLIILRILKSSRMLGNDYYNYFYRRMRDSKATILSDSFVLNDNRDFKSEYNLGLEIPQLDLLNYEQRKGTEYVKLNYLKEIIIAERDETECDRLIKLYNKWISNPAYTSQLDEFEKHLVKLYIAIFKISKLSDVKDRDSLTKFLLKNLDMNKINTGFIQKAPGVSAERHRIILDTFELIKITQTLVRDKAITKAAGEMQIQMVKIVSERPQLSSEIKSGVGLDEEFVSDQFESIKDALKLSTLRL